MKRPTTGVHHVERHGFSGAVGLLRRAIGSDWSTQSRRDYGADKDGPSHRASVPRPKATVGGILGAGVVDFNPRRATPEPASRKRDSRRYAPSIDYRALQCRA